MWKGKIFFKGKKCEKKVMLKDVFDLAEHPEKTSYEWRYKLIITGNNNHDFLKKSATPGVVDAKFVIRGIDWYIPHYTPSVD